MPRQPNPRPLGRPKLGKGEAKAKIVPVRLNPDHHKSFWRLLKMLARPYPIGYAAPC